jgi:hypothetical protein
MATGFSSPNPLQPLNIGNIVNAAFVLYRSHLKQYLGITLRATLWTLLGVIAISIPIVLMISAQLQSFDLGPLGLLLIPLGVGIALFPLTRSVMNLALISWLAYRELVQQPETTQGGRRELLPRAWRLFSAQVLVAFLLVVINIGLSIVQGALGLALIAALGEASAIANLLILVINLITLIIYLWFSTRWSIPELPIAVENVSSAEAVNRSWTLTKENVIRILTVLFVGWLVTIPPLALCFIPFFSTLVAVAPRLAVQDTTATISLLIALAVSVLLFLVVNVFILPFWQALKAVIYYDLRSRREGIDLQLRNRQS